MDPEPKRDFLYIKDAIDAFIAAGEYDKSEFEIFNLGSGTSYSVDQIVGKILKAANKDIKLSYNRTRRQNEIMDTVADIKKAKLKLVWEPKISLQDGLSLTLSQNQKGLIN
jgi:UDP-glucose 4-epimerase